MSSGDEAMAAYARFRRAVLVTRSFLEAIRNRKAIVPKFNPRGGTADDEALYPFSWDPTSPSLSCDTEWRREHEDDVAVAWITMPPLPAELIDMILGYLENDLESLRACAYLSRTWRTCCQRYLHDTLELSSRVLCEKAVALYGDSSPRLRQHIKRLVVQNPPPWMDGSADIEGSWVGERMPRIMGLLEDAPLRTVLLSNLRLGVADNWAVFPEVSALELQDFTGTTLAEVQALLTARFPKLKRLAVDGLNIDCGHHSADGRRPQLQTLQIRRIKGQDHVINWFLDQPVQDIRLQELEYCVDSWTFNGPAASVERLGTTVRDLTLVFQYDLPCSLPKNDPLLPHLSSLQTLTFDFSTTYGALYGVPSVPALLRLVNGRTRVNTVIFRFGKTVDLTRRKFAEADRLLSTLPAFSRLARVIVEVHVHSPRFCRRMPKRNGPVWPDEPEELRTMEAKAEYWKAGQATMRKEFSAMAARDMLRMHLVDNSARTARAAYEE